MARRWIEAGINGLAGINGVVATVLFAGLTAVVSLQVFTRFVLHAPFIWSEEVARFLFFWVALLGASMSVKARRHFVIDVTMGHTGGRRGIRHLFRTIPDLFVLGFSVLLLFQGIGYTEIGLFRTGTNSQLNMSLVYAAIPVFAALSVIYSVGNLILDGAAFLSGDDASRNPHQADE